MYAQVVVLTYQSPDIDSYTYEIPKELKVEVGQLVEVPFGKRNPTGIVLSISPEIRNSKFEIRNLKKISKIIFNQPLLLPYQIELLKWMSEYYMAPMVNCFEAAMPPLNAKSLKLNAKLVSSVQLSAFSVQQTLVLVPTINQIPETLAKFPRAKNYVVYHNELKLSEKFAAWQKIQSGKADYIFGSRSAIFSPCPNLKEIIIYDEHDGAYKDERSPYFDTLTVAQKISALTKAQIKIVDASPKITTYFQLKSYIKMQMFGVNTKIISMRDEKLRGNFSPISSHLQEELRKKQHILLFLNKKKESGSMFCKNCKFNDYFEKHPEHCPKCKSQDIYFNVLNVDSLRAEVKKITKRLAFPPEARLPLRSEASAKGGSVQRSEIDIQTATVFYSPKINKYDTAVYIQPDSLLNRADLESVETLYSHITNLKKILPENGTLIIQTYNPDDETLKYSASGNYDSYFKSQLENRRLLSYPPFALLVKLTIKGKDKEKIGEIARKTFSNLNSTIQPASPATCVDAGAKRGERFNALRPRLASTRARSEASDSTISLLGPYNPIFFSKNPTFNIIIKYKLGLYNLQERQKAIKKLSPIFHAIDKGFQITVEPASLN